MRVLWRRVYVGPAVSDKLSLLTEALRRDFCFFFWDHNKRISDNKLAASSSVLAPLASLDDYYI